MYWVFDETPGVRHDHRSVTALPILSFHRETNEQTDTLQAHTSILPQTSCVHPAPSWSLSINTFKQRASSCAGNLVQVSIEQLTKHYGALVALDNVSLKINSGEVFGLLGPNGAGKSTLLKTIVGILRPTSGTIKLDETDIVTNPEKAKRMIGYLPENPSLYTGLTTQEFLQFVGKIRGVDDDLLDREISGSLKSFSLEDKRNSLVGSLSKGMKQKVALIATSLHSPDLLVLDEPLTALDPKTRVSVKDWIGSQTNRGVTTILSTHDLDVAQTHSERIAIIDHGKIIAVGNLDSLRKMANTESDARLEDVFLRLTAEKGEDSILK